MFSENIVAFLRAAGWKHQREGLWVTPLKNWKIVEERAPGAWDRSVAPYLAQAILKARARAARDEVPLAVLNVKRATALTDERLARFVRETVPEQNWLLVDSEGRVFAHTPAAPELAKAAAERPVASVAAAAVTPRKATSLFTDLNQWLLKVLLAPALPEKYLNAPRGRSLRNATTLGDAADVSVPVAVRFLHALEDVNQLNTAYGALRVSRPLELLQQWKEQVPLSYRREIHAVSVRPANLEIQVQLAAVGSQPPRLIYGVHSACTKLGLGHVQGALPVLWAPSVAPAALKEHELVPVVVGQRADVILREPRFPRSLYRGAVRGGFGVAADVLQCWLDASHYRLRGEEQADFLWRTVLVPSLE